jgi:annexin A7/11
MEDLAVASIRPIPEFLAKELHEAITGAGTSEDVLIEILCSFNNHGIRKIKEAYQASELSD